MVNSLFRKRIGLSENEKITFEMLDSVLEKTAKTIPFENLCLLESRIRPISKENLIDKILIRQEGGLCYELNPILYYFLVENGFHATLTRGIVYHQKTQRFLPLGSTHVTILVTHKDQTYLTDTGFGGNLPLKPVPLNGETVTSANGQFRVRQVNSELGNYKLEMKLRHKHTEWETGYVLDSRRPVTDFSELDEIQTIIAEHPESPFNKHPLITKRTENGSVTLTNKSFTRWEEGRNTKENIDRERFETLMKQYFN